MKDVMIDIETMGTRSTSMIVQIGACYFDRETGEIGKTFKININPLDDKLTVDWHTIKWWLIQSEEARNSIIDESFHDTYSALTELQDFLNIEAKYIWSHATFDIPILLNAFHVYNLKFPLHYTKMRDIRTLMDIANHKGNKQARVGTHHDALDDCEFQVKYCVEAMNKLKS